MSCLGFGLDPSDLVVVSVDEGHPGPLVVGVAPFAFREDPGDHGCRVLGDAGHEPLVLGDRRRGGSGGVVGCGQDVGGGARHRRQLVDGADLGEALAVALLSLG